jgi:hypothetical protein
MAAFLPQAAVYVYRQWRIPDLWRWISRKNRASRVVAGDCNIHTFLRIYSLYILLIEKKTQKKMATHLVDSSVQQRLTDSLHQYHAIRVTRYSMIWNIIIGTFFFLFFGTACYCAWKNRPSPEERKMLMMRDQQAVLNKIAEYRQKTTFVPYVTDG